jgi:ComF family protein
MRPIEGGVCSVCGERIVSPLAFAGDHGEARCGLCQRMEHPFDKAVAYGSYEGGLRDLIHMLKYEGVRPAANVLGRMLAEVLVALRAATGDVELVVVPVPLHPTKLRQRGFNQSEMVARIALKLAGPDSAYTLLADALERTRITQSQIGLTRHQRRENLRGAFRVAAAERIAGRDVLLVDDVFTTGTTASECSRILRRAGASRVWVATVARTLKSDAPFALLESSLLESREDTEINPPAHG